MTNPMIVRLNAQTEIPWLGYALGGVGLIILGIVVWYSKREAPAVHER